jgi:hypothetical protein
MIIKSRTMRRVGHGVYMREMRNAYKILAGKPERKSPFGRPGYKWKDYGF